MALVAGLTVFGFAATGYTVTTLGPWICQNVPGFDAYMATAPFVHGPLFALAGVAHFVFHQEFTRFYPHKGAWGFWLLPGSPSFHVYWTGVAEVMGGIGLALGAARLAALPDWLLPVSAFGLFVLTTVVTPANIYMYTHNAPGPLREEQLDEMPGGVIPWWGHAARALLQVVLMSTFLGLALDNAHLLH